MRRRSTDKTHKQNMVAMKNRATTGNATDTITGMTNTVAGPKQVATMGESKDGTVGEPVQRLRRADTKGKSKDGTVRMLGMMRILMLQLM